MRWLILILVFAFSLAPAQSIDQKTRWYAGYSGSMLRAPAGFKVAYFPNKDLAVYLAGRTSYFTLSNSSEDRFQSFSGDYASKSLGHSFTRTTDFSSLIELGSLVRMAKGFYLSCGISYARTFHYFTYHDPVVDLPTPLKSAYGNRSGDYFLRDESSGGFGLDVGLMSCSSIIVELGYNPFFKDITFGFGFAF